MSRTILENYRQWEFYTVKLFRQVDRLYKQEIKVFVVPYLLELQNKFFSIQIFDHLKWFFVHDFEDSFWEAKTIHSQRRMPLFKNETIMWNFVKCFGNVKKNTSHINSRIVIKRSLYLCIIDSNWTIHKSPGRKSDWEGAKNLLLRKWFNRELQITLSNILPKIGSKLIGRQFY